MPPRRGCRGRGRRVMGRRGSQEGPGMGAPCGPSAHGERVMPDVRLTDPLGHGTWDTSSNSKQTAPGILGMVAQ